MMNFSIQDQNQLVSIYISGYENKNALDVSDANWLSCRVRLKTDFFTGEFNADLTTDDFLYFYEELEPLLKALEGTASFQTDEGWLEVKVKSIGLGKFSVAVVANPLSTSKSKLSFNFEVDQTYLSKTRSELKKIVTEYPVIT